MKFSVHTIEREFTPSEAAAISGVSPTLQRDWRRREILRGNSDGRWTRWTLTDVIRLSVMKLFSEAGMDVSNTTIVAQMAIFPTLAELAHIDGAVSFEGDELPAESQSRIRASTVRTTDPSHSPGRFLASYGKGEYDVCRTDDLASLEEILDADAYPILLIVDCRNLARLIVERAGGPLIRYEITVA